MFVAGAGVGTVLLRCADFAAAVFGTRPKTRRGKGDDAQIAEDPQSKETRS